MSTGIQALREQRTAKAREMRALLDQNPTAWSDDLQKQYDALGDDVSRLDQRIANLQKSLDIDAAERFRRDDRADRRGIGDDEADDEIKAERRMFASFLRGGWNGMSPDERMQAAKLQAVRATMSTGTGSQGGYTVPTEFSGELLEAMKAFGGMRSVATVFQTSGGNAMNWPTTDGTSEEGEIIGENTTATGADISFNTKQMGSFKFSSKVVAVPFELLQDSGIDIEALVRARLAERIARITNRLFTAGAGTTEPEGVVTGATLGKAGTTGQTTTVIYDDLIDLVHSVDPAYRASAQCRFMFHDNTLRSLKKLKDTTGRPLWVPGVAVREPDTLDGYGYAINQNMPVMAASAKTILFGDFARYRIRDVMGVTLFRFDDSAYIKLGQIGFLAWSRHDGKLLDVGGAVKYYQNSAT